MAGLSQLQKVVKFILYICNLDLQPICSRAASFVAKAVSIYGRAVICGPGRSLFVAGRSLFSAGQENLCPFYVNPFITEIFFCSDRNEISGH